MNRRLFFLAKVFKWLLRLAFLATLVLVASHLQPTTYQQGEGKTGVYSATWGVVALMVAITVICWVLKRVSMNAALNSVDPAIWDDLLDLRAKDEDEI